MTEYDVQLENGVLNRLDNALHYTYSVWPSSEFKKNIPMKFWQKQVYNYDISCD